MMPSHPILFYDRECGLCDRSVRWCMRHDHREALRYAPLQGSTYAAIPIPGKPTALDTLVLLDNGQLLTRSNAALAILTHVGGGWRILAAIGRVIPRTLRDAVYRIIARNRRRIFGGPEACQLPTAADRARLLP